MSAPEEWRPVVGHDGYEVSSHGRVMSHLRGRPRLRAQFLRPDGYLVLGLHSDKRTTRLVHQLVAEAFHGPRQAGLVVRHLNGDQTDNRAENLRWGTRTENNLDAVAHGTHHMTQRTRCPQGHPYNEENTRIAQGKRRCRTCERTRRPERIAARAHREAA